MKITFCVKILFFISIFYLIKPYYSYSQNRLLWFNNAWNYEIIDFILPSESFIGQTVIIDLTIKCLESTDNTGYIRILAEIVGPNNFKYSEYKDISLVPTGNSYKTSFEFAPSHSGIYNIIAEIKGGGGYLWSFERESKILNAIDFTLNSSIPSGLNVRQPIKESHFTTFIFEINPETVNKASEDYSYSRKLVQYMTYIMANDRFKVNSPDAILSGILDATIEIRTNELFIQAKEHQNETLQVQYKCDDSILPFLELMKALENLLSTSNIFYGISKRQDTPLIDINLYFNHGNNMKAY